MNKAKFTYAQKCHLSEALQGFIVKLVHDKPRWSLAEKEIIRAALGDLAEGYERLAKNRENTKMCVLDEKNAQDIRSLAKRIR